jgi:DNA-directed RNA polymerase specialized sigma24 family protein
LDIAKLVDAAKQGDRSAYDRLFKAQRPALEEYARRFKDRLPPGLDEAGLVEATGARGWLRVRQIGTPAAVAGWFRSLMEAVANRAARKGAFGPAAVQTPGPGRKPGRSGLARGRPAKAGPPELIRLIRAVLDSELTESEQAQLSETDRQYLRTRFLDGVRYAEMGKSAGVTPATARARCERALQRLVAVVLARDANAHIPL